MLCVLVVGAFSAGGVMAAELPELQDKPWLGCFAGHEGRGFDFALGADGKTELFFKKGRNRVNIHARFKISYVLEEQIKDRWVRRSISKDGFETEDKPSEDPEKLTFTATFTGDTKVEITHEFEKSSVIIGTKIVGKGTENPLRCGVSVMVADLYRHVEDRGLSERDLKKKIDAEIAGETVKGERKKADLYEKPELGGSDYFEGGAKWFSFESNKIAGKTMTLRSVVEGAGTIEVNQTKTAYNGFYLNWYVDPAKAETSGAQLEIEIK